MTRTRAQRMIRVRTRVRRRRINRTTTPIPPTASWTRARRTRATRSTRTRKTHGGGLTRPCTRKALYALHTNTQRSNIEEEVTRCDEGAEEKRTRTRLGQ